ncbi:hypothetical protein [Bacillus sp. NPDC094106]|uniref:hypothetical protein n=1 Tax=Bacillus sp. NPDC094106 TaxID=3363949 RepID=UPI0037FF7CF6
MKKEKVLLGLLGATVVVGIGSSIWFAVANPFAKEDKAVKEKVIQKKEETKVDKHLEKYTPLSKEEISKMTEKEKKDMVGGDGANYESNLMKVGQNRGKEEYPEDKAKALEKELIQLSSSASYDKVLKKVKEELGDYQFTTGINTKIASIYYDASIMMSTLTAPDFQKGKIAKNMRHPEMMVIGTIMLPEKERRDVIHDFDSLSPIVNGDVKILNHEVLRGESNDPMLKTIQNTMVGAERVHKIEFEIEKKNNLIAYVIEYNNATLEYYGMYAPKDKTYHYKTIRFFKDMDKDFDKHQALQEDGDKK